MTPYAKKQQILKTHISKGDRERRDWDKWNSWYLGEDRAYVARQYDNLPGNRPAEDDLKLDTNYPYAFVDTMVANICPSNPLVTVNARDKEKAESATAREALINDTFRRDKLHSKTWSMSTYAAMCGRSFSKTVWSMKARRPVTRVVNPRNIFYDMSVDWEDSRYVIEAVPMTKEEFDSRVRKPTDDPVTAAKKFDPEVAEAATAGQMPSWLYDKDTYQSLMNEAARSVFSWVIVYEYHDLTDGTLTMMLDNGKAPLWEGRRPYQFLENPYTPMVFNQNLVDNSGVSDIKLISRIQERLNELDALELWFAHCSIPVMILNENAVDNLESARSSLQNCTGPGDIATIGIQNGNTIETAVTYTKTPAMSPSFDKMRERCVSLIEFTLGIPQYARGVIGGADVATEVALADTATRTRNGRRIKVVEDWVVDVARKCLALWREFMPKGASLTLRGRTAFDSVIVDLGSLAFPEPVDPLDPDAASQVDDDWYYDYETVPYSPTENHKLIQLQKLQQFMQFLAQNPAIDPKALMWKLTELLGIEEVRRDPSQAQPPGMPMPGAMPQQPGGESQVAPGAIPTNGSLPPGQDQAIQAQIPPSAYQFADQPKA